MNRSILISAAIFVAFVFYLCTGLFQSKESLNLDEVTINESPGNPVMTVRYRVLEAEEIAREVLISGRTLPMRSVKLIAEVGGRVEALGAERGEVVSKGTVLARLAPESRPARAKRAEAELEQRRLEWEAALRLSKQGLVSESQLAGVQAAYRLAEEVAIDSKLQVERLEILAPFDGVMNERSIEVGDVLPGGTIIGDFLELTKLKVVGELTESQVPHVKVGEQGVARFADGREIEGRIEFVDLEADRKARTYGVELLIPNEDLGLQAGRTAEIAIKTEQVWAHRISTAHVSIADDGRFGVKYVDEANRVHFIEADMVKSSPTALWLTGLPQKLQLITVGQGFTKDGDVVEALLDESNW